MIVIIIIDEINIVDEATGDENYEIFNVNVSGVRGVTLQRTQPW